MRLTECLNKYLCCCFNKKNQVTPKTPNNSRVQALYLNNVPNDKYPMHHKERSTDMVDMEYMLKWNGYLEYKK